MRTFHHEPTGSAATLKPAPPSHSFVRVNASTSAGSEPRTTAFGGSSWRAAAGMARLRTAPSTTLRAGSFDCTAAASSAAARRPTSCACSKTDSRRSGRPNAACRDDSCRARTDERSLWPSRPSKWSRCSSANCWPSSAQRRATFSPVSSSDFWAQPTSLPPRLTGAQGPPGGGKSRSAGPWRRWSGIDSIPPPTLTHIGVVDGNLKFEFRQAP